MILVSIRLVLGFSPTAFRNFEYSCFNVRDRDAKRHLIRCIGHFRTAVWGRKDGLDSNCGDWFPFLDFQRTEERRKSFFLVELWKPKSFDYLVMGLAGILLYTYVPIRVPIPIPVLHLLRDRGSLFLCFNRNWWMRSERCAFSIMWFDFLTSTLPSCIHRTAHIAIRLLLLL